MTDTPTPAAPETLKLQRKIIAKVYSRIAVVVAGICDEGDRVYFGSTNDAEILRELNDEWSAHKIMGEPIRSSEQEVACYRAELTALRAEVATLRASEARMREALEQFSIMAGEMFARNWHKDGVAISFVGRDGPIRLTFEHFMAARLAVTTERGDDNELA